MAAVSVGIVEGSAGSTWPTPEDKDAGVDANVVMVHPDRFVEVQGTGEQGVFSRDELDQLIGYAGEGHPAAVSPRSRRRSAR